MHKHIMICFVCMMLTCSGFFICVPMMNVNASGVTFYVGGSGPGNYTRIQDAVDNASSGDTVFVFDEASPYKENVTVGFGKNLMLLVGEDRESTRIEGSVTVSTESVTLSGFTITRGILLTGEWDGSVISDNRITSNTTGETGGYGVLLDSYPELRRALIISDNLIYANVNAGVRLCGYTAYSLIMNNTFQNNGYGIEYEGYESDDNLVYHNNFISNTHHAVNDFNFENYWNQYYPVGGNYWDDYSGNDANGDGFGDTAYEILSSGAPGSGGYDYYPLMVPWDETMSISLPVSEVVFVDDGFTGSTPGWGVDHFSTIQAGIQNVRENGLVYVYSGVYAEHVVVPKQLTLRGQDLNTTIISGDGSGSGIEVRTGPSEITGFMVQDCENGLTLRGDGHLIHNTRFSENTYGVRVVHFAMDSILYHNIFVNNTVSAEDRGVFLAWQGNIWDDGYPSGGNSWDDYTGVDEYQGPNQNLNGSDGIGDTPYPIPNTNAIYDRYPLMEPFYENQIPVVSITRPAQGQTVSGTYSIEGTASDPDGVGQLQAVQVQIDSGSWVAASGTTSWSYSWNTKTYGNGQHIIRARSSDGDAFSLPFSIVVTVYNEGGGPAPPPGDNMVPVADLSAGGSYAGTVNAPVFFNGSKSYDPDGVIKEWRWAFGDGTTGSGETVSHRYSSPGTYTVSLTVVDLKGATDTDSTNCVITEGSTPQTNTPPVRPTISGSIYGTKNVGYDFTLRSTDADYDSIRYFISWGDQSPDENTSLVLSSGTPHTFRHRWAEPGIFTVTAWASDGTSASTASSLTIFIDVKYTGDIGYLINEDGDGLYDRFFCNSTKKETAVEKQESGLYLIDSDGDGAWDHCYNPSTSTLSLYTPKTPGFELVVILCAVAAALIIHRRMRRNGF